MRRGKCWEIRLEEERDTRINTLLSCIIPCAKLGWTLKGSTRVIARIRCCHFIYWRPDLHYSVNERVSTHLWDQTCDHLLDLCLILYSCPSLTKKSKWTHQFTFMSPTAFSSLLCARNMTHTYHENKKIRYVYIAVEIISGFFFPATSKKLWLCFQCGKRYMWKDSLKKHLRVECGKEPTYECPICGRKFKHKHRWQSHARLIHYLDIWLTKQARV